MSEFNPTHKDLLTIDQRILDIKQQRSDLIKSKINIQNELSRLSEKYKKVDFESPEFKEVKSKRSTLKYEINKIELEISSLKDEIGFKTKLRNEVSNHLRKQLPVDTQKGVDEMVKRLSHLKNKYTEFAKDRTRVASLRVMASEFIGEIENILNV